MRNLIAVLLILVITGCTQQNTPVPQGLSTTGPTMDSTEALLEGVWYLRSKADSLWADTALYHSELIVTNTGAYTEFKSSVSPGISELSNLYMDCTDGSVLSTIGMNLGNGLSSTYWYYNENAQRLIVTGLQYQITLLTADSLVVYYGTAQSNKTFYFTH